MYERTFWAKCYVEKNSMRTEGLNARGAVQTGGQWFSNSRLLYLRGLENLRIFAGNGWGSRMTHRKGDRT